MAVIQVRDLDARPVCFYVMNKMCSTANPRIVPITGAIAEFRDMKTQPSLEPALRHKETLKAQVPVSELSGNI